ncbi:MAG: DNA helicase UvrD, partial [Burkholderiaceae bacterium]|nr:DNA helicase UvrD [Burkholderiaceae bacterium]
AGGVQPGQIQVLCRKRESLRLAAAALESLGVPCAAVEEAALFDAPEVRDLVAVLDVLASPGHALSLAQALKSPIFGCSDADLVQLASAVAAARGDDDAPGRRTDALAWWSALHRVAEPSGELARARALFDAWQQAARVLPPHDLLDRIVDEGQVIERTLAAVPPTRRAAARAAIDALLAQSLMLDGARGATPYNFVRALRRRRLTIAAPAQPDAVQLLTIHGAKGLEAEVVFVMDTQPEVAAADTATLLVQWPVDSPYPTCCAFVYAESRCPPLLRHLFDDELAARRREELNGLYVAMTRAKHRVVVSATAPHRVAPTVSWWQRLAPHTVACSPAPGSEPAVSVPVVDCRLRVLPGWQPPVAPVVGPIERHAAQRTDDSDASRLGQAVHRVLEWAVRGDRSPSAALDVLCAAAAREFGSELVDVQRVATAILTSPACQRFFDPAGWIWAGNEVGVSDGGEALRIDRLVHLRDVDNGIAASGSAGGVWWVLDYKLSQAPQELDDHRQQLQRYLRAVAHLQPGATVKAAFITGQGTVVELT